MPVSLSWERTFRRVVSAALAVSWLKQHPRQQQLLEDSEEFMLSILKQSDLVLEQMWAST